MSIHLICTTNCSAQKIVADFDSGYSVELVNGPVHYESTPFAKGTPYLYDTFRNGTINTCMSKFVNVNLNYDLIDQKLVLLIQGLNDTKIPIVANPLLIEDFVVDGLTYFKTINKYPDIKTPYALIISEGELTFFVSYHKELIKSYSQNNPYGFISDVKTRVYLVYNSSISEINRLRSLKRFFPEEWKLLRTYIKEKRININNITHSELRDILLICNSNN